MGLLRDNHYHSHCDGDTIIKFPDTIKVHEHKAPTDESIRLMEEMHDKALKNIIAKVKVENNIVNGECWVVEQPWLVDDLRLLFKFKINNHEFNIEKQVSKHDFYDHSRDIIALSQKAENYAKGFMLWYALKMFTVVAYEQITKEKLPDHYLNNL